jgi:hypothetical protein
VVYRERMEENYGRTFAEDAVNNFRVVAPKPPKPTWPTFAVAKIVLLEIHTG